MPTYEYQCAKCNYRFEAWQKISDSPLNKCPKCGQKVKRLISAGAGFIFKGPGFYATDYRSPEYKQKQKQESAAEQPSCPAAGKESKCKSCPANKDGQ